MCGLIKPFQHDERSAAYLAAFRQRIQGGERLLAQTGLSPSDFRFWRSQLLE
jgi:hypothetical protein